MQSRLEEEEDTKAALMSRIQRLTKLILVSSKNAIPGYLNEAPNHQRSHSFGEEDKLDAFRDGMLIESDSKKDTSTVLSHPFHDGRHKRSSSRWNDEFSPTSSAITESTQAGELISKTNLAAIENLEREIQEKRKQMRLLEQRLTETGESSMANSSLVEMQQSSGSGRESGIQIQKFVKSKSHEKFDSNSGSNDEQDNESVDLNNGDGNDIGSGTHV